MASHLTASDGTELVVEVEGVGPPVVFVHGSNGGLDSWAEIAARHFATATVPDHVADVLQSFFAAVHGSRS
ncbi:hypothetical protein BA059_03910 [Mycolicibacterium sp. (ex Dasyatis americana)]|uniref:alpha/beta fold hydrolase n=1 Tax=Mycobacterium TaxID=1763 RepID=UPI0008726C38|nr:MULTISPECIES: hypothetical protein [Mycobacterium]MCG7608406.1 hypothetical protein [Mycobacterium sp. CnD-18-1]OFB43085.1 hypothetical protein BA059_03910 [Mycolicibacterium sp. (ex Dasyatis americana)]OLT94168.1 hypothetical protein BKG60_19505 [Mycobacterium syngnathidarum]